MKFIRKNWFKLIIVFVSIVGILWVGRTCSDAIYEKKIGKLDDEIAGLEKKNVVLKDEAVEYVKGAEADKKIVEGLKAEIAESKLRITELEKEEAEVEIVVMELPPTRLVEETQEVLGCEDIMLNKDGILFSIECARQGLLKLKKFSLVEGKYNVAISALSKAEKALQFSERRSLKLFGALWKLGSVVINYKGISKAENLKFKESEKQKKKSWFNGLFIGFAIGAGITMIIVIIVPLIKLLI